MAETVSIPPSRSIIDRIRYRAEGYKPIEARIAGAILEDPDAFTRAPIVDFAKRSVVSTGSVVRFAQLHGYTGFRELKLAVAREYSGSSSGEEHEETQFARRIDAQVRALLFAREMAGLATSIAARHVARARNVDIAASGSSASIASAMLFSLTTLGIHARALQDPGEQAAAAALLTADDVLIVISYSGRTRAAVDAAQRAREAGALVVGLTCNPRAPLLAHTDAPIVLDAGARPPEGEWPMRTAMYAVARALVMEVAEGLPVTELRRRRGKWSSGRFAVRYDER